jgi:ATP-dependent Clp protease ATP-binding subunit ClpA
VTFILTKSLGEYQDRRHRTTVDCSNTIWILATNAHDQVIQDFYALNHEVFTNEDNEAEKSRLSRELSSKIKQDFLARFDVSVP